MGGRADQGALLPGQGLAGGRAVRAGAGWRGPGASELVPAPPGGDPAAPWGSCAEDPSPSTPHTHTGASSSLSWSDSRQSGVGGSWLAGPGGWMRARPRSPQPSLLQVGYCAALLSSMAESLARGSTYWSECDGPHALGTWGVRGHGQPSASLQAWGLCPLPHLRPSLSTCPGRRQAQVLDGPWLAMVFRVGVTLCGNPPTQLGRGSWAPLAASPTHPAQGQLSPGLPHWVPSSCKGVFLPPPDSRNSSTGNPPASADHGGALGSRECPEAGQPPSNP